ncbi:MAG: hypothetical protein FWC69_01280, partial [Defluviitaleaceae bacterium]|nr:hypothetical protein [Defluviitaleaceae bacterium]
TLNTILKIVAVLAVLTAIIFFIVELVNETPVREIFTENWAIFLGALVPVFAVVVTLITEKKEKKD